MERAIAVRRQGAKSCPRYRSAVAKWTRKLGSTFVNPVTGRTTLIRTPKGTIPEDKLVRAVNKGVTVLPNGGLRFDSKPVQAVLAPYSKLLEQAAAIEREPSIWAPSPDVLTRIEQDAPHVAALIRSKVDEDRAYLRRGKSTRIIAQLHQLIVDQYGWPERD